MGGDVHLKLETEQPTGSFKLRGAANKLLSLSEAERERGVVAMSSGNHGRAVAYVAGRLGVPATVFVSGRVPRHKQEAITALGAEVVVGGADLDAADAAARRLVSEQGRTWVSPFDDAAVIAGQGTIGLEILDDLPGVADVVVPLSGGGLISGIALTVKAGAPATRVVGVSQERGPAMYESLRAGRIVPVVEEDTLADALAGGLGEENLHTMAMVADLVDDIALVSERQIAAAMAWALSAEDLTVEGGGAVGLAALLAGVVRPRPPAVVVVSGGNVAQETLAAVVGDSDLGAPTAYHRVPARGAPRPIETSRRRNATEEMDTGGAAGGGSGHGGGGLR